MGCARLSDRYRCLDRDSGLCGFPLWLGWSCGVQGDGGGEIVDCGFEVFAGGDAVDEAPVGGVSGREALASEQGFLCRTPP